MHGGAKKKFSLKAIFTRKNNIKAWRSDTYSTKERERERYTSSYVSGGSWKLLSAFKAKNKLHFVQAQVGNLNSFGKSEVSWTREREITVAWANWS